MTSSSSLESNPESGRSPDSDSPGPSLLVPEVIGKCVVIVVLDPGLLLSELGGGGGGGGGAPGGGGTAPGVEAQFWPAADSATWVSCKLAGGGPAGAGGGAGGGAAAAALASERSLSATQSRCGHGQNAPSSLYSG